MSPSFDPTPLGSGPIHWFGNWPIADVPVKGSLVYTNWNREDAFVYVGMSGRSEKATGKGPWGRLYSRASGRRSGDQFCVDVSDRFVLARLQNRITDIADGSLSLDGETRDMSYGEVLACADTEEKLRQAAKARRYHHGWVRHEMLKRINSSAN